MNDENKNLPPNADPTALLLALLFSSMNSNTSRPVAHGLWPVEGRFKTILWDWPRKGFLQWLQHLSQVKKKRPIKETPRVGKEGKGNMKARKGREAIGYKEVWDGVWSWGMFAEGTDVTILTFAHWRRRSWPPTRLQKKKISILCLMRVKSRTFRLPCTQSTTVCQIEYLIRLRNSCSDGDEKLSYQKPKKKRFVFMFSLFLYWWYCV